MFNGCQILISTPTFLVRFMNRNEKLINFKNLRYLILDGGDIIFNKYYDSVNFFYIYDNFFALYLFKYNEI